MNILFLCTGNSCRSILAEATFNHLAPSGWRAMSAGSHPTGQVHPRAIALLQREGIATAGYASKSWHQLPCPPDIVISVCGNAADEICATHLASVPRVHWGVDDPAHVAGPEETVNAAFSTAYGALRGCIEALMALPLESLQQQPLRLKSELDRIGEAML